MKLYHEVILLRVYEDGRISNQSSVHPTFHNAVQYCEGNLKSNSCDGYVVIEHTKDAWSIGAEYGLNDEYTVSCRGNVCRIVRAEKIHILAA